MSSRSESAAPSPPGQGTTAEHFTVAERTARGKAERAEMPRRSHGEWEPAPGRPDPISLLEEQSASRVKELVPIRYGRMLVSPFTFFRGAAYVMASDLSDGTRTGLVTQLCGDAHLTNFGAFAAPDRRLVFSVNDFDETGRGPFEWDVKRLVASFAVAGRERGFDVGTRAAINETVTRAYREGIQRFAAMRDLDVWYARIDVDDVAREFVAQASSAQRKRFEKGLAKARTKDSLAAFDKLTELRDGEPRIVSNPPLIVPLDDVVPPDQREAAHELIRTLMRSYRRTLPLDRRRLLERYRYVDTAHKVVGVGSVGTRAWIVLLLGRDDDDPLFLQAKEASSSVLEPFVGKSEFANHGQRVVEGQRLMQSASDIMLGWLRTAGLDGVDRDYYVRQLWDSKGSVDVEALEPKLMTGYANLCGLTLARAHARSGDAIAIASYLGTSNAFDKALGVFAETYADQNERDYTALDAAVKAGRIQAETGV
jgi:uncharacterized protein (DUF2252 family)